MAYRIRYRDDGRNGAKTESTWLRSTYGAAFASDFDKWLADIAANAEARNTSGWVDAVLFFDGKDPTSAGRAAWDRFRRASLLGKMQILAAVIQKRRPPCAFYITSAWFPLLDGVTSAPIQAAFEVDHVNEWVVFHHFVLGESESPPHE